MFNGVAKWGFEKEKNYSAYFRLLLAQFLPKDLTRVLYMDVDMLAVRDISELFTINLENNILGAAVCSLESYYLDSKHGKNAVLLKKEVRFNSGLMLIDLAKWRDFSIQSRALDFLQDFYTKYSDQCCLNYLINGEFKKLPLEYNFIAYGYLFPCLDEEKPRVNYTRNEHINGLKNLAIIHYNTSLKPWFERASLKSLFIIPKMHEISAPYEVHFAFKNNLWWFYAVRTVEFRNEFIGLFCKQFFNIKKTRLYLFLKNTERKFRKNILKK